MVPLFLFLIHASGQDQDKTDAARKSFHSLNTLQVLNGSTTTSVAINTVNGFQVKRFFAGIGTGFDYYYHVTVPLFLETRFNLAEGRGKLQVLANGGVSFPFASQNKNLESKLVTYEAGGAYGAGIDYLLPFKTEALIIGVAYSGKQVIHMVENNVWNPVLNRIENMPIKDKYSLNRIALRAGWMF